MTASAHDVAAALRERLPHIGTKKLHKLLYYCQGHHLATFGKPLFSEHIHAWDMGPVVATLWREEDRQEPRPEPHTLGEAQLNTVGYVISRYGRMNGNDLERLSHAEDPWITGDRRRTLGESDRIELAWIEAFFTADAKNTAEDDEPMPDRDEVRRWLADAKMPESLGTPDTKEALLARLTRA